MGQLDGMKKRDRTGRDECGDGMGRENWMG